MSTGTLTRAPRSRPTPTPAIDPRLQARRMEVSRGQGRKRLRRIVAVGAVLAVAGGGYALTRSPLLDVDHVTLEGARGPQATAVTRAAAVPTGAAMAHLDTDAVADRVAALPWVRTAEVERVWPGTVTIHVTARTPVAVDQNGSGIDREGLVIGPVADATDLPRATLPPAEPGTVVGAAHRDLLAVLAALPAGLRSEVASGATVEGEVVLTLHDGIRVRFGAAERLSAKFAAVEALLDQAGRATTARLDVRVPSSPSLTRRAENGA